MLVRNLERASIGIACLMSVFQIWTSTSPLMPLQHCSILVGFSCVLTLLNYDRFGKKRLHWSWVDGLLSIAGVASSAYFASQAFKIIYRQGVMPTVLDTVFGVILVLLILEMTRRTCGPTLPIVSVVFLLYGLLGQYLPPPLGIRAIDWERLVSYLTGADAIFSVPMQAIAHFVFLYILFSAFLMSTGAGRFFIDLASALTGGRRGGPAKMAVVSSALFGTISGNSQANVVATGTFTIPMMINMGYTRAFAGAVEAVASTGGQITPPILGAAAFVLAEITGTPYLRVVSATVIPAVLFYLAVFLIVDLEAQRLGLRGLPPDEVPAVRTVLRRTGNMLIPLIVLVVCLVPLKLSAKTSAQYAIVAVILASFLNRESRMSLAKFVDALRSGAEGVVGVLAACASAGIVIGVLSITGMGLKMAEGIIGLSGGITVLALVLGMITSLILGMGLPTTAAYVICAAVIAPVFIDLGINLLAAHIFLFYFACLSAITPPVALAVYTAAGLADAPVMGVAWNSIKVSCVAFIVPYMFVFNPVLLGIPNYSSALHPFVTATVGVVALAVAVHGYLGSRGIPFVYRTLLLIAGLTLIEPGLATDLIGALLLVISVIGLKRGGHLDLYLRAGKSRGA